MQTLVRGNAARKEITNVKQRKKRKHQSATTIQAAWRGHCARLSYRSDCLHIIHVQALVRGNAARKKITNLKQCKKRMHQSEIPIQTGRIDSFPCLDGKGQGSIQETAEVGSRATSPISNKKQRHLDYDTSSSVSPTLPLIFSMPSNQSADPENVVDDNTDEIRVQDFVRNEGIKHQTATVEELRRMNSGMNNIYGGSNNNYLGEVIVDEHDHESEDDLHPTADTGKKNRTISVDDVTSQGGEVESAATSSENLHTIRETSHRAKNVSDQDEAESASSYNAGETGTLSDEAGPKIVCHAKEKMDERQHHDHYHHRYYHHRHHLNEDTLNMLKVYLQSDQGEYLDEDAVVVRMLKMERVRRNKYKHHLCEASEKEDNDAALSQAYQAVEDHTLALDFYNNAVAGTRKENPGTVLDKKTLDWLRKAIGLHRRDELREAPSSNQAVQSHESDVEAGSQGPKPHHLTRGVARSTRIRRREERAIRENMGLDALLSAVMDLEEEHGPFLESKPRVSHVLEMLNDSHGKNV